MTETTRLALQAEAALAALLVGKADLSGDQRRKLVWALEVARRLV
jgi:hypothetical protein